MNKIEDIKTVIMHTGETINLGHTNITNMILNNIDMRLISGDGHIHAVMSPLSVLFSYEPLNKSIKGVLRAIVTEAGVIVNSKKDFMLKVLQGNMYFNIHDFDLEVECLQSKRVLERFLMMKAHKKLNKIIEILHSDENN